MAQDIQVPQTVPNAPQFQVPTDLVNAYLARQQQGRQDTLNRVQELGNTIHGYQQQKIQNQLAALGAISQLYGAGGPRAVNAYAPQINQTVGSQMIPPQQQPEQTPNPQGQTPAPATPTAGTVQDKTPSPYIQASLQAGHPDVAGVASFHAPATAGTPNAAWNAPQPSAEDLADIKSGGLYGKNLAMTYKDLGDIGMQPITAQQKQQEIYNSQPLTTDQTAVLNDPKATSSDISAAFPHGIPPSVAQAVASRSIEKGKGSAEQQNKYQLPEMKIQVANSKLQDLYDAYNQIPESQKGAYVGLATGKAGSVAGNAAPELVTYNKLREAAAVSLAIARNPENPRPSPQDIADELKNLPSAGDDPKVAMNLFNSTASDLKQIHSLNTQGAQSAAASFGGQIQPGKTPTSKFDIPTISSTAAFKALPSGAKFKDPSGQVHRKK